MFTSPNRRGSGEDTSQGLGFERNLRVVSLSHWLSTLAVQENQPGGFSQASEAEVCGLGPRDADF